MTTISAIEVREIAADLGNGFSGGTYNVKRRAALLCRIALENGHETTVCVGNESEYSDYLKAQIRGPFRNSIVGKSVLDIEKHWQAMLEGNTAYIPREDFIKAVATVDTALWVMKAEELGVPLWSLLGGAHGRVRVIGIGGYYETSRDAAGIEREMAEYKRLGLAGIKFKVGAVSLEEDARRVRAAREAAGPDFAIVVDSNMAWTPTEAVRFANMIRDLDPEWIEEPVHPKNVVRGLKEVRYRSGLPTGAGQSEISVFDSFRLLTSGSVDVLNMTYNRGGGISAWQKLAHAAEMVDIRVAQVGEPHISMHLMGGAANSTFVEIYPEPHRDPFWHNLYRELPPVVDGYINLPTTPGIGMHIDLDEAEKYATEDWS